MHEPQENVLRTRLRDINIEYSALVKNRAVEAGQSA